MVPVEELEVMRLVATGLKDHAIAQHLSVSIVTVRRRAQQFRERVGANTRAEAIAIAAARGWVEVRGSGPAQVEDK
jgi:DNA-binding NarL/FixJ family response regulator